MTDKDTKQQYGEAAERVGESVATPLALFATVWKHLLVGLSRKIPFRQKIQKGMIMAGVNGLKKASGADFLVFTIYGDKMVVPRPGALNREEGKIETSNGESWALTEIDLYWIGKTPVVWAVSDDHELVSPVAARIAEAVDSDWERVQPVQESNKGISPVDHVGATEAVADGGTTAQPFDDVWVDANNPLKNGDGWIVSMAKAYDMHWSQSSAEEMQNQETRGRLAEKDPDQSRREAIRLALVALGGIALGMFGPALAQRVAGTSVGSEGIGLGISHGVGLVTQLGVV